MLSDFDWIRRTRNGTELLVLLHYLTEAPDYLDGIRESLRDGGRPGPPPTALTGPCSRCWIYPCASDSECCPFCQAILEKGPQWGRLSRQSLVIWGFVNWLPRQFRGGGGFQDARVLGAYTQDANHFLVMIPRLELQPWLQEIVLHHGADLKGHLQVLPTMGTHSSGIGMGDILCRAIDHETYFPMDKLRIRFYRKSYQVMRPQELDREGLLTFEISEFLSLLEMAMVFRSVVYPEEQKMLYDLLTLDDPSEEKFYWGRFLGILDPEARDLLEAWKIRTWSRKRVKFLYEMMKYVRFQSSA
jgi:hypothetical protein